MKWWVGVVGIFGGVCFGGDAPVGGVTGGVVDGEVVWRVSRGGVYSGEGEELKLVLRPEFRVMAVAALGERKLLLGGGEPAERGVVALMEDGAVTKRWEIGGDLVYGVAATRDGAWTAVACADGSVLVSRGVGDWSVVRRHTGVATSVVFSDDGRWLASGGLDGAVIVSEVGRETAVVVSDDHTAGVTCLAFSPDGERLASGARDSRVRLHTVEGRLVRTYTGLGMEDEPVAGRVVSRVLSLAWDASGLRAGTSKGGIYRLADGDEGWERDGGEDGVPVRFLGGGKP